MEKNKETNGKKLDNVIDKGTEKAIDTIWQNEHFQKEMKNTFKSMAYNFVAKNIPMKTEPGKNHPLGKVAEKLTEKVLENDKVQNHLKEATKTATKEAIKNEVKKVGKETEKKKGFTFF